MALPLTSPGQKSEKEMKYETLYETTSRESSCMACGRIIVPAKRCVGTELSPYEWSRNSGRTGQRGPVDRSQLVRAGRSHILPPGALDAFDGFPLRPDQEPRIQYAPSPFL